MKKYVIGAMALATVATLATAIPAFAKTNEQVGVSANANTRAGMMNRSRDLERGQVGMMRPGIIGTVSAVSGNTITVLGRAGFGKATTATTTYTVDATNAKVTKANATSSVSNIAVGDTVAVQGTITGTNVVATIIRDGITGGPGIGFGRGDQGKMGSTTPAFTGNGQPIIAGTISSLSGSTIGITNKSNITYTVDATNAKILQGKTASNISTLKTGDAVVVQGTINGTSVVATTVIDQQAKPATTGDSNKPHPGFFGGIGQFFMHFFGF